MRGLERKSGCLFGHVRFEMPVGHPSREVVSTAGYMNEILG